MAFLGWNKALTKISSEKSLFWRTFQILQHVQTPTLYLSLQNQEGLFFCTSPWPGGSHSCAHSQGFCFRSPIFTLAHTQTLVKHPCCLLFSHSFQIMAPEALAPGEQTVAETTAFTPLSTLQALVCSFPSLIWGIQESHHLVLDFVIFVEDRGDSTHTFTHQRWKQRPTSVAFNSSMKLIQSQEWDSCENQTQCCKQVYLCHLPDSRSLSYD